MQDYTEQITGMCRYCGKPVYERTVSDNPFRIPVPCPCVVERWAQEEKAEIDKIKPVILDRIRRNAGLRGALLKNTFDNFIPDEAQIRAYRTAIEYVNQFPSIDGLMLYGSVGGGKTHLAAAIVNSIIDRLDLDNKRLVQTGGSCYATYAPIKFVGAIDLLTRVKASYNDDREDSTQEIISACQNAALLVIDDFGAERQSEWTGERWYEIINYRYSEGLPLIITTNCRTNDLPNKYNTRLLDRLKEMCAPVKLAGMSHRKESVWNSTIL